MINGPHHLYFLAAQSSSRSLVVDQSVPPSFCRSVMFVKKWPLEYKKVFKTYLPTYLWDSSDCSNSCDSCDSRDSSDSCDSSESSENSESSDSNDSSDNSDQKLVSSKKLFY